MPIEVSCPGCPQKIHVPDPLIGTEIRCQTCNAVFVAEEEIAMEVVEEPLYEVVEVEVAALEETPKTGGQAEAVPPSPERLVPEVVYAKADDASERRQPRRKQRRHRADAAQLVYLPGMLLTISGYLGWAINGLFILLGAIAAIRALFVSAASGPTTGHGPNAFLVIMAIAVQVLITVIWGGFVVKGGQSLSSMTSYPMAIAGCVVAFFPCSLAVFMALPIGIWGLVVLLHPEVRRAFARN